MEGPEERTEPGLKERPLSITKDRTDSGQTGELWGAHGLPQGQRAVL